MDITLLNSDEAQYMGLGDMSRNMGGSGMGCWDGRAPLARHNAAGLSRLRSRADICIIRAHC